MTEKSNTETRCSRTCHGKHKRDKRGPTSYKMHNSELVFEKLALTEGTIFLDLGCGPGDYSVHAAKDIGATGKVYALDREARMLEEVSKLASSNGLTNIEAISADMTLPLPFKAQSVDYCFISTALHCIDLGKHGSALFKEINRVLKDSGQLAILECKKERADYGPPYHMRISAEEIKAVTTPLNFAETGYIDLGCNYLLQLSKLTVQGK